MSAKTPAQALAKSRQITKGYGGLCLKFVRLCYGIPARDFSAKVAWDKSKKKHKVGLKDLGRVPVGAPLFFSPNGNPYGHVAVYAGKGLMRTTNSRTNRIHTSTVESWVRAGYALLGWTEDLNGVAISGLSPEKPSSGGSDKGALSLGDKGDRVKALQQGLNKVFPAYRSRSRVRRGSRLAEDGSYGPHTAEWVRLFQVAVGLTPDKVVGPKTVAALAEYGVSL